MKKLKLVLVLLACVFGSLCGFDASASKTIYAIAKAPWSRIYAHAWNDQDEKNSDWGNDAQKMSETSEKYGDYTVYTIDIDDKYTKMILHQNYNNNENKSEDVNGIEHNALYIVEDTRDGNNNHTVVRSVTKVSNYKTTTPTVPTADLYIRGEFTSTGWEANADYKLTKNGNKFSRTFAKLEGGKKFKIADNNWNNSNTFTTNNKSMEANKTYDCPNNYASDTDMALEETLNNVTVTLDFTDAANPKITFSVPTFTEPSSLTLKGWKQGSGGNPAAVSTGGTKNSEGKYILNVDLSDNYGNFFFESGSNRYVPNKDSGNETVSAGSTIYTAKTVDKDYTAQQFSFPKGVFTVTAWFEDETLKFTVAEDNSETATLPSTILVQGYKPNSGTWYTFATLTKDAQGRYPFSINVSDADWYKFVFVCNNARYTPAKDNDNETVERGEEYSTWKKAYTYNEQQFLLNRGSYTGEAWFDGETLKFKFEQREVSSRPTIYMFFVNDMHGQAANRNDAPKVTFYDTKQTGGVNNNPEGSDDFIVTREMVKVTGYGLTDDYDLYKYEFNDNDIRNLEAGDIVDACFWFPNNSGGKNCYTCGHEFSGRDWDQDHWLDYIYVTDSDDHAGQSYMTFAEWAELRSQEIKKLYLLGKGFKEFTAAGEWGITSDKMMSTTSTMGVFYPELTWESNANLVTQSISGTSYTGAGFKMSYINPYEWYTKHPHGTAQCSTRSWMTFNLGCIGYDSDEVARDPVLSAALNATVDVNAQKVLIEEAKTMPNNNYNQYDWFIEKTDKSFTLIVDLDGECESVTLLPFSCQPSVSTDDVHVNTYCTGRAASSWSAPVLEAEMANGLVLFNYVNVASADGHVEGFSPFNLNTYRYRVVYEFYADGTSLGTFTPDQSSSDYSTANNTYTLAFEAIPFGTDVNIGVRARFTDLDTKMTFHSKYFAKPMNMQVDLDKPTFSLGNKTYVNGSNFLEDSGNPRYTLGAQFDAFVNEPQNEQDYVWYADFRSEVNAANWAESHHSEHPQHANGGEIQGLGHTALLEPDFTSYDDETHNWAHHLGFTPTNSMNGTWTIKLPEVVEVKRTYAANGYEFTESGLPSSMGIDVKVAAVYPFLVDNNAQIEPSRDKSGAPRKADAKAEIADYDFKDGHVYTVYPVRREADVQTIYLDTNDLTGISDLTQDNGAATGDPVEYFNLQGMKVDGSNLTPGIYIRRQGAATEKMIIR